MSVLMLPACSFCDLHEPPLHRTALLAACMPSPWPQPRLMMEEWASDSPSRPMAWMPSTKDIT